MGYEEAAWNVRAPGSTAPKQSKSLDEFSFSSSSSSSGSHVPSKESVEVLSFT